MSPSSKVFQTALGPIEVCEAGAGPAVLVLHGSMGGWQQAALLARTIGEAGYRYLAVSRPGYLATPLSAGEQSADQADLYAALLDSMGIQSAAVIGVSAGSPSAIDFALRHPTRNWGLVLVSACSGTTETPKPPAVLGIVAQLLRLPPVRKRMRASYERNLDKPATMFISDPDVRARTIADPEVGPLLTEFMTGTLDDMHLRVRGTKNDIRIMATTDHALEQLAIDTLVIHGTADNFLDYTQHAKAFEERIPHVQLVTIEGGEHAILFTDRDVVRSAVAAYLRQQAPRAA